MLREVSQSFAI